MLLVSGSKAYVSAQPDSGAWAWLRAVAHITAMSSRHRTRALRLQRHSATTSADHERQPSTGFPAQRADAHDATSADGQAAACDRNAAPVPKPTTFDLFYTQHEQALYGYLRRLLPSNEVAVELAQETFFRAWQRFDTISGYERPEAWLYRVATNLAISHLRRRRPLNLTALLAHAHPTDAGDSDESAGAGALAAPLDMEGQAAERDAIARILRTLPERQRAALLLAAAHGFTSDEIAASLGVSSGNARQILSRARERFRRLYDEAHTAR